MLYFLKMNFLYILKLEAMTKQKQNVEELSNEVLELREQIKKKDKELQKTYDLLDTLYYRVRNDGDSKTLKKIYDIVIQVDRNYVDILKLPPIVEKICKIYYDLKILLGINNFSNLNELEKFIDKHVNCDDKIKTLKSNYEQMEKETQIFKKQIINKDTLKNIVENNILIKFITRINRPLLNYILNFYIEKQKYPQHVVYQNENMNKEDNYKGLVFWKIKKVFNKIKIINIFNNIIEENKKKKYKYVVEIVKNTFNTKTLYSIIENSNNNSHLYEMIKKRDVFIKNIKIPKPRKPKKQNTDEDYDENPTCNIKNYNQPVPTQY